VIGTTVGHYRITERLGEGGMGVVYRAEDVRLGRQVAVKFLPPELAANAEALDRFRREARVASSLNHPNICTLHDVGPNYLVMELVEGPTLAERIKAGALPLELALRYGAQMADALAAAHARGIVHRDLKPGNVMLGQFGETLVVDWGLAKATGRSEPSAGDATL
jgi:non-specific serine/threonine protein kinase